MGKMKNILIEQGFTVEDIAVMTNYHNGVINFEQYIAYFGLWTCERVSKLAMLIYSFYE